MITRDNSRYLRLLKPIYIRHYKFDRILEIVGYRNYTVRQGDLIEDLSSLFLGDPSLYWILLGCNKIIDPFASLEQGIVLIIPEKTIIQEVNK